VDRRRVADAYALWTFSPSVALRLLGSNLLAEDALSTRDVVTGGLRTSTSTLQDSHTNWQLRLELKL
jgi:iron complex outermembrane receptor protein